MELRAGMTANLGFGISAVVPRTLLEEGHAGAVTWAIEQGAVGGMPLTGFAFGRASNAWGYVPSPQQFTYFQGGGFDLSFLSFLEVHVEGNVNVSRPGKKPYLTAGCGGFVDITAHARKFLFSGWFEAGAQVELSGSGLRIAAPGKFTKMVDQVEHVTFSGARARAQGQEVLYVTERCVIRLTGQGLLATEVMPGIDPARDIVDASKGRVRVASDARVMPLALRAGAGPRFRGGTGGGPEGSGRGHRGQGAGPVAARGGGGEVDDPCRRRRGYRGDGRGAGQRRHRRPRRPRRGRRGVPGQAQARVSGGLSHDRVDRHPRHRPGTSPCPHEPALHRRRLARQRRRRDFGPVVAAAWRAGQPFRPRRGGGDGGGDCRGAGGVR
jgi:acyl CoA:acetate/3-ketoacid CoA transferase beta subunit